MNGSAGRLRAALEQLEERLRRFEAPIIEQLRPGIPPAQVRRRLAEHGLSTPEELEALWAWHNGTNAAAALGLDFFMCTAGNQLLGGWYLMTLDEAADEYTSVRRTSDTAGVPASWFPVLHFLDDPVLCADCSGDPAAPAPLYLVDEFPEASPNFASLAELVETMVRLFDEGYVRRDAARGPGPELDWESLPDELRVKSPW